MADQKDFTTYTKVRTAEAIAHDIKAVTTAATYSQLDSSKSSVIISGSTAAFSIQGILAGVDGQRLLVINMGTGVCTFEHQHSSALAVDRIITLTGSDVTTTGAGAGELVYSAADSRWILYSSQG